MTTLATETWTGTTGAAWPSQWINGSTQGTATIQANAGRMLGDGNGYRRVNRFLNVAAVGKSEVYVEVTLSALTEHYSWIFLRANSASGDQAYPLGYGVVFGPGDNTYTMELGYGTGESLATTAPITYVAANRYGIRLRADGTSFMSRVWNLTGAEPTSWALTSTDTDNTFPTGRVELGYMSGNAANPGTTFDNLTLTDAASGTAYTATAAPTTVISLSPSAAAARAAAAPISAAATVAAVAVGSGTAPSAPSASVTVAATATTARTATAAVAVTATPTAIAGSGITAAAVITTTATPAATNTRSSVDTATVTTTATPTGSPSRGLAVAVPITADTTTAAGAARAGVAVAAVSAATAVAAPSGRAGIAAATIPVDVAPTGVPSRGSYASAPIGIGLGTDAPDRAAMVDVSTVNASPDVNASTIRLVTDTASIVITPTVAAGATLGVHDHVEVSAALEYDAVGAAHTTAAAGLAAGISVLAAPGDVPPGAASLTVDIGITATTRAGQRTAATITVPIALTAEPSSAPAGSAAVTLTTLLEAASAAARNTPAAVSTAASVAAAARTARTGAASITVGIGLAAVAETDDPNPIIRITARLVRRTIGADLADRTITGTIPARLRKGHIVNRYPYGTREFVAVAVTDGTAPITTDVEFALAKGAIADDAWKPADLRSSEIGFTLDGTVPPGTWTVFARYTKAGDRPIVECGQITVSGRRAA